MKCGVYLRGAETCKIFFEGHDQHDRGMRAGTGHCTFPVIGKLRFKLCFYLVSPRFYAGSRNESENRGRVMRRDQTSTMTDSIGTPIC
jgi:hypothetical protein